MLRFSVQSFVANYKLVNRKFGMCRYTDTGMYVRMYGGILVLFVSAQYTLTCVEKVLGLDTHTGSGSSPLLVSASQHLACTEAQRQTQSSVEVSGRLLHRHHLPYRLSTATTISARSLASSVYVRYQLCAQLARPALTLTKPLEIRWSHLPAYGTRFRRAFNAHHPSLPCPLTSSVHIETVVDPPTHPVLGEIHCHNFSRGKIEYG